MKSRAEWLNFKEIKEILSFASSNGNGKRRKPVPRYRIENRVTKEVVELEAPFAQTACEMVGWAIGNCHVKLLREGPFTNIKEKSKASKAK